MAGLVPGHFLGRPQAPRFKEERHDWAAEKRAGQRAGHRPSPKIVVIMTGPPRFGSDRRWTGHVVGALQTALLPSRPGEFHPEPLTDSGLDTLASSGSCHRMKAAAFR
jgi:hypothetical protein